jgi:hypothetical protein
VFGATPGDEPRAYVAACWILPWRLPQKRGQAGRRATGAEAGGPPSQSSTRAASKRRLPASGDARRRATERDLSPLSFDVRYLPLPADRDYVGTWGSRLVAVGSQPAVALSLPTRRHPVRWGVADLVTGEVRVSKTMRGELRDGFFEPSGEGWLLTTQALCRVDVSGDIPAVVDTLRPKGLGTYLWRLLAIGPDHLGATGWATASVALVGRQSGRLEKRLRIASPHLATTDGDLVRLFSPHGGECLDVRLPTFARTDRRKMPFGTNPVLHDGELFMLAGRRIQADRSIPINSVWRIEPETIVALDPSSLAIRRQARAPMECREVLAVDSDNRLVVSTDSGFVLLHRDTLREEARAQLPDLSRPVFAHEFVPGADAIVISPDRFVPTELAVVTWHGGAGNAD